MADDNKTEAQAAANAPARVANAVAATAVKAARDSAKAEAAERARARRLAKREETKAARAPKAARRGRPVKQREAAKPTQDHSNQRKASAERAERTETMNFDTNGFAGLNGAGFAPFQNLFANAGERSQDVVRRSQKAAEDMADITRSNVEAIVEAGRLASEGARSIGQDVVARGRQGVEQAADAIRTLAEAKSPTEFVQLQGEFARTSFDRMVAETSRLTESMVKLAGEAFQPLSNRASANVQRFNSLSA